MSNPNIIGLTAIRGKVTGISVPSNETTLISNSSSSSQIIKINTILAANITSASTDASLLLIKSPQSYSVSSAAVVGTVTSGAYTLTIPISSGPFLSTSTNVSGSTMGTGFTVGSISTTYSGSVPVSYSVSVTGATGATAGTQSSFSWTNPAVSISIAPTVSIPASSSIVLISKDSGLYLEEGDFITVKSNSGNVRVFCAYEVLG